MHAAFEVVSGGVGGVDSKRAPFSDIETLGLWLLVMIAALDLSLHPKPNP